jgi:hypothetical protein
MTRDAPRSLSSRFGLARSCPVLLFGCQNTRLRSSRFVRHPSPRPHVRNWPFLPIRCCAAMGLPSGSGRARNYRRSQSCHPASRHSSCPSSPARGERKAVLPGKCSKCQRRHTRLRRDGAANSSAPPTRGAPTMRKGRRYTPPFAYFEPWSARIARLSMKRQFITRVLMRLGTSPTGMTALIFMLAVSMAVTDRSPELEM